MTRNKLYTVLFSACILGHLYLLYSIFSTDKYHLTVCMIKNITGYPCPSCGTTRAIQLLVRGDFMASLQMNPFGIIVAIAMTIVPIWIAVDVILKRDTFFKGYKKTEAILRTPWLAIILILLVILNWIWNIYKHL